MNIPLFTREEFNLYCKNRFHENGIIPTDEAYESYRKFVLDIFVPVGTGPQVIGSVETPDQEITITVQKVA